MTTRPTTSATRTERQPRIIVTSIMGTSTARQTTRVTPSDSRSRPQAVDDERSTVTVQMAHGPHPSRYGDGGPYRNTAHGGRRACSPRDLARHRPGPGAGVPVCGDAIHGTTETS